MIIPGAENFESGKNKVFFANFGKVVKLLFQKFRDKYVLGSA